jgi:hypothetical protein
MPTTSMAAVRPGDGVGWIVIGSADAGSADAASAASRGAHVVAGDSGAPPQPKRSMSNADAMALRIRTSELTRRPLDGQNVCGANS